MTRANSLASFYACSFFLSTWTTLASAACTTYIPASGLVSGAPNDQIYTSTALVSHVVSAVVNCSGSALGTSANSQQKCNATECALSVPPYYLVNIEAELNISTSAEQKRDILALVKRNTSMIAGNALYDFNSSMTVSVSGSACIAENTLRWYSFTPTLTCAEGTLQGCSGDGPSNGTPIKACGAKYFAINNNGFGIPAAGPNIVIGSGFEARAAPANATIIDNSRYGNGASVLAPNDWTRLALVALVSFMVL